MKVAKSKLRRIILEELQFILSEQDDDAPGSTRVVPRAELRRDAARRARRKTEKDFFGTDSDV